MGHSFVLFNQSAALILNRNLFLMIDYKKIFENPLYIKWIFNPDLELDLYWDQYLKNHPEEAPHLLELKSKLRNIRLINENLSDQQKIIMALEISKKLDREDKKSKFRQKVFNLLKYAAVAVLFFSIGAILFYTDSKKENFEEYISLMKPPPSVDSPMLILPEGQSIAINKGESTLDYSKPGEIILNEDSIIDNKGISGIFQLVMPYGSSSKIVLNDGSIVWLNAGSRLLYPSNFTGKTREVVLFGEAYFKVVSNMEKPFIVQTSVLEITALGTEFNVSAYPEDNVIQTVLKSGSVAIRIADAENNEKEIILFPNQLATFNKETKQSVISKVNTDFHTLWTNGLLCFENQDLNRIIKSLERYYNIKIQFEEPLTGSLKISGKLDLNRTQEEVFEYISKVSDTKFEQVSEKNFKLK